MLDVLEYLEGPDPRSSVIWLHGVGADGSDFLPVAQMLGLPFQVRYVFPHAPVMSVTCNGGMRMPAWYDIYSLDIAGEQDESGIRASAARLVELVEKEQSRGVAAERIVLAGFSQGGAIALQAALRLESRLAGVMALSTYLPLAGALPAERSPANAGLPVFMAHGTFDTVIPISAASASRAAMEKLGYEVEWHDYPMAHSVCNEELEDIRQFLTRCLSGAAT